MPLLLEQNQTVAVGEDQMVLGENLFFMHDSSNDLNRIHSLRKRLWEKGYLYFKGFHQKEKFRYATKEIVKELNALNAVDNSFESLDIAKCIPLDKLEDLSLPSARAVFDIANKSKSVLFQDSAVSEMYHLLNILNSDKLFELFSKVLDTPVATFSKKWMRAVRTGDYTGIHADTLYMGRGSKSVYTVWTPLHDIPLEKGGLVLCEKSHLFDGNVGNYRQKDSAVEKGNGWLTKSPLSLADQYSCKWVTENFQAGDVVIFGLNTLHCSTVNTTDEYRFSCDTRFQPINDEVDSRYKLQM
jgi:ectoine hydroxylase-related dioxygenase (phytanoyl-CoA dioxygenase family)